MSASRPPPSRRPPRPRVLVVDAEGAHLAAVAHALRDAAEVSCLTSAQRAAAILRSSSFDVVFIGETLAESAMVLARSLAAGHPGTKRVLVTDDAVEGTVPRAELLEVVDAVIAKPVRFEGWVALLK